MCLWNSEAFILILLEDAKLRSHSADLLSLDLNATLDSDRSFPDCDFKWAWLLSTWFQYWISHFLKLCLEPSFSSLLLLPYLLLLFCLYILAQCCNPLVTLKFSYTIDLPGKLGVIFASCCLILQIISCQVCLWISFPLYSLFSFITCLYYFMLSLFLTWAIELPSSLVFPRIISFTPCSIF